MNRIIKYKDKFSVHYFFSQTRNYKRLSVSLSFLHAQFPTEWMNLTLYRGIQPFEDLQLLNCSFRRIDNSNIFLYPTFNKLVIQNMNIDEIEADAFAEFPINSIKFNNVRILKMRFDFLKRLAHVLEELFIEILPDEYSLNDIFNYLNSWEIQELTVMSKSPKFYRLSSDNFSSLPVLQRLDLSDCGIGIIDSDTFARFSSQFNSLNLRNNQLKTVQHQTFNRLIELHAERLDLYMGCGQFVNNCIYFEFLAILAWNIEFSRMLVDIFEMPCNINMNAIEPSLRNCSNLQIIHREKFCWAFDSVHAYPKFFLRIDESKLNLSIHTEQPRKFRLLTFNMKGLGEFNKKWGVAGDKCPKRGFLQQSIRCLLFNANFRQVPLASLYPGRGDGMKMELMNICVNYVSAGAKRMWPLHCIAFTTRDADRDSKEGRMVPLPLAIASWILGMCMAFGVGCLIQQYLNRKNEDTLEQSGQTGIPSSMYPSPIASHEKPLYASEMEEGEYESIGEYLQVLPNETEP